MVHLILFRYQFLCTCFPFTSIGESLRQEKKEVKKESFFHNGSTLRSPVRAREVRRKEKSVYYGRGSQDVARRKEPGFYASELKEPGM